MNQAPETLDPTPSPPGRSPHLSSSTGSDDPDEISVRVIFSKLLQIYWRRYSTVSTGWIQLLCTHFKQKHILSKPVSSFRHLGEYAASLGVGELHEKTKLSLAQRLETGGNSSRVTSGFVSLLIRISGRKQIFPHVSNYFFNNAAFVALPVEDLNLCVVQGLLLKNDYSSDGRWRISIEAQSPADTP